MPFKAHSLNNNSSFKKPKLNCGGCKSHLHFPPDPMHLPEMKWFNSFSRYTRSKAMHSHISLTGTVCPSLRPSVRASVCLSVHPPVSLSDQLYFHCSWNGHKMWLPNATRHLREYRVSLKTYLCPQNFFGTPDNFLYRRKTQMFNEFWCQSKVDHLVQYLQLLKNYIYYELLNVPEKSVFGQRHGFWDTWYKLCPRLSSHSFPFRSLCGCFRESGAPLFDQCVVLDGHVFS